MPDNALLKEDLEPLSREELAEDLKEAAVDAYEAREAMFWAGEYAGTGKSRYAEGRGFEMDGSPGCDGYAAPGDWSAGVWPKESID